MGWNFSNVDFIFVRGMIAAAGIHRTLSRFAPQSQPTIGSMSSYPATCTCCTSSSNSSRGPTAVILSIFILPISTVTPSSIGQWQDTDIDTLLLVLLLLLLLLLLLHESPQIRSQTTILLLGRWSDESGVALGRSNHGSCASSRRRTHADSKATSNGRPVGILSSWLLLLCFRVMFLVIIIQTAGAVVKAVTPCRGHGILE
mmetsp:Transcript_8957/g.19323  ORF Transcript_8957/g.19323 Transcript_8957/m.19323 type:complete len:201 (-) Transcript_8957:179-781(-)